MATTLTVNGDRRQVDAPGDTPLLYVLRNDLEIGSPQFGCGLSQCGACSVLVDGKEVSACVMPLRSAAGKQVTTVEGLPARWASQNGQRGAAADAGKTGVVVLTLHPVQQAWIDEQVPMCGFCQHGMMIKATELLEATPAPTVDQIKTAFMAGPSPHLCRCGTYSAIVEAVQHAATLMAKGK